MNKLPLLFALALVTPLAAQQADPSAKPTEVKAEIRRAELPEDLLGDEHLREEFGVNGITTPSIQAIFELLDTLGTLSYDRLQRPLPKDTPRERVAAALSLGALIADGFLVVQCEKIEQMDNIGRALLKHAKVLGAGARMNRHSQSLLEQSLTGDWKKLRTELSKTQFDVEAEMVQLRDVDIAHLVSLGGWLRAFHIATQSVEEHYAADKTRNLARRDIADYYLSNLDTLSEKAQALPIVKNLRTGLQELLPLVDVPEGKELSKDEVHALYLKAKSFTTIIEASVKD